MRTISKISAAIGLVVVLVGMTPLAPRSALAAEPTEDDANAAALAGRYQDALEAYAKLYARTREPTYLHNVARCYQKMGKPDEAIDYFNKYLRLASTSAGGTLAKPLPESVKEEVLGYIREMEALKESRRREKAATRVVAPPLVRSPVPAYVPPPAPAPVPAVVAPPSTVVAPVPPPVTTAAPAQASASMAVTPRQTTQAPPPSAGAPTVETGSGAARENAEPSSPLRTAGAIVAIGGLVSLAAAGYFGVRTLMLDDDVASAKVFDAAKDREGARAHTMQYVMFGTAGVLLLGSAVLYYVDLGRDRRPTAVSLLPAVGPAFSGASLTGGF